MDFPLAEITGPKLSKTRLYTYHRASFYAGQAHFRRTLRCAYAGSEHSDMKPKKCTIGDVTAEAHPNGGCGVSRCWLK